VVITVDLIAGKALTHLGESHGNKSRIEYDIILQTNYASTLELNGIFRSHHVGKDDVDLPSAYFLH
jgi:hypothetical protein